MPYKKVKEINARKDRAAAPLEPGQRTLKPKTDAANADAEVDMKDAADGTPSGTESVENGVVPDTDDDGNDDDNDDEDMSMEDE